MAKSVVTIRPNTEKLPLESLLPKYAVHSSNLLRFAELSLATNRFVASEGGKRIFVFNLEQPSNPAQVITLRAASLSMAIRKDGKLLAVGCVNNDIELWDLDSLSQCGVFSGHLAPAQQMLWSSDGKYLASTSSSRIVRIWDVASRRLVRRLEEHSKPVSALCWSPSNRLLATGSSDGSIYVWEMKRNTILQTLIGHRGDVTSLTWNNDGSILISGGLDRTVRVWDITTGYLSNILEGHTFSISGITYVDIDKERQILISQTNAEIIAWQWGRWEIVARATLDFSYKYALDGFTLFAARTVNGSSTILSWNIDIQQIPLNESVIDTIYYSNAKCVLVGDTGVGKSALGLVLTGKPWVPTESTHGRRVWTFCNEEFEGDGRKETREVLLWDLAGQPGYRLIHQLHLNEVAVALVVFDARSDTDPFAGVRHWDRALRQAQRLQRNTDAPVSKFLIAARTDRGGISVSRDRIDALMKSMNFLSYVETSAKEGTSVDQLSLLIRSSINWNNLPRVSSTVLFQKIKAFLVRTKETGTLLLSIGSLFEAFIKEFPENSSVIDLQRQFETCIGLVEARGLIRKLSFGGLVLLQPELLDAYASALVNAAKDEPDGLGCINEEDARKGRFRIPEDERITDREQEELLLICMIEDLLRYEIALRENTGSSALLVFPSQLTRENPDLPDPEGKSGIFSFEGSILNIYATLAVRLSHSGFFKRKDWWKNAATFAFHIKEAARNRKNRKEPAAEFICGIYLREREEGRGEIITFFGDNVTDDVKDIFEDFIYSHLLKRSILDTLSFRRVIACESCETPLTELQIKRRRERGFEYIECVVCGERISIKEANKTSQEIAPAVPQMDKLADNQRELQTASSILQGKIAVGDYDVFLCHNEDDKEAVRTIDKRLRQRGILPWLDEKEIQPGMNWVVALEESIKKAKSAAVIIGKSGLGPWQHQELVALLIEFARRGNPIIPVLLADARIPDDLPVFLKGKKWVEFKNGSQNFYNSLCWGITGDKKWQTAV